MSSEEKAALHKLYPNGDQHVASSADTASTRSTSSPITHHSLSSKPQSLVGVGPSDLVPTPSTSRRHSSKSSKGVLRSNSKHYQTYPPPNTSSSSASAPLALSSSSTSPKNTPLIQSSSKKTSALVPAPSSNTPSPDPLDDRSHKRLDSDTQLSIIFNGIRFRAIPIQHSNKPKHGVSHSPQNTPAPKGRQKRRSQNKARAYNVSSPSNVQHVMHIEWNEDLQAYTGIPDVWTRDIPQSALRFSTLELPSHINPRADTESEHGDSARERRKQRQSSCIPSSKRGVRHAVVDDDDDSVSPAGSGSFSAYKGRRRLSNDYRAEYLASVDVEYERAKHKAMIAELPGNAPGPRVFPGPRARFQQPSFRNTTSILKLSVRHYLEKLGFDDLEKEYRVENLRELLLERLKLGPERNARDTLVHVPYAIKQQVFSFLDVKSYLYACRTCSEMAALMDEPLLWRPHVLAMHTEQGFLHQQHAARSRGWKVAYLAMQRIVRDPSYCDCIWNIVVQGDTRVGRNRLVYTLGDAMLQRNRKHCTKDIRDDPAIDAVTGIYRFRIDFVTRRVVIEDRIIKLQVWDGGLVVGDNAVFGAAHIVLMLLDLTEKNSLKRLPNVVRETFQATKAANSNPRILLVGNTRGEDEKNRAISFKNAKRFANERGLVYLEANVDNPNEVDKAFVRLTEEFAKNEDLEFHRSVRSKRQQCLVM